jgi:hypothetical protein
MSGFTVAKNSSERWSTPGPVVQLLRVGSLQAPRHERPEVDQHVGAEALGLEPGDDEFDTLRAQADDLGIGEDLLERDQRLGPCRRLVWVRLRERDAMSGCERRHSVDVSGFVDALMLQPEVKRPVVVEVPVRS